jgi:phosphatidylserine decarboxylase
VRAFPHQYIDRETGRVCDEATPGERLARLVYSDFPLGRQGVARLFSGEWTTRIAALAAFDVPTSPAGIRAFAARMAVREDELIRPLAAMRSRRDVFIRQIRYDTCRPMDDAPEAIASPADSKLIAGDLAADAAIRVKERFFDLDTLVGSRALAARFGGGAFGVFRLAPPDYHYFHAPASGVVVSRAEVEGTFYSVNPIALAAVDQILSSNRRVVIVIDTDVEGGSHVGRVAMIPVAAQVIGRIEMTYHDIAYECPAAVGEGLFVRKGRPMGLFHPGSSTVVLLFERGRIAWCPDFAFHRDRGGATTRYSANPFGRDLTEVALRVRDTIAFRAGTMPADEIALPGGRRLVRDGAGWVIRPLDNSARLDP